MVTKQEQIARAGKRGDFLGQASLGWTDLDLLPGEASRELNLTLGYRDGVPKRDQELVRGTIQMLVEAPVIEVRGRVRGYSYASPVMSEYLFRARLRRHR